MPVNGKTAQRGYGSYHQRLREKLLPKAYGKPCPKCGEIMLKTEQLDLGHTDDRTSYTGIEHASCNRRAGAQKANRNRKLNKDSSTYVLSPIQVDAKVDDL